MAATRASEGQEESYSKEVLVITLGFVEGLLNKRPTSRVSVAFSIAMRLATLAATASLFSRLSIADEQKGRCRQQELFFFHETPSVPSTTNDTPAYYLARFSGSV